MPSGPSGIVYSANELVDADAQLKVVIMGVGAALEKAYPGWGWTIEPANTMIKVAATRCNPTYGFYMSDRSMEGASYPTATVVRLAGELLERFGMPRRGFERSVAQFMERRKLCKHPQGWLIPDLNDKQTSHLRMRERKQQGRV